MTSWFDKRRGGVILVSPRPGCRCPVIMPYISELIENFGWRQGFLIYSAFTFLVVVPLISLVISRPETSACIRMALCMKLDDDSLLPPAQKAPPKMRLLELFKEHNMIVLTFSLLFCSERTLTHMIRDDRLWVYAGRGVPRDVAVRGFWCCWQVKFWPE